MCGLFIVAVRVDDGATSNCKFRWYDDGGRIFDKYGTKFAAIPGFLMTGLSMILLAQITNETSINYLLTSIILLGLGQGLVNMQVNNHALQSAPLNLISRVTPMSNELLQVVNSFAIAFITAFL